MRNRLSFITILCICISISIISGCKKYVEGPSISFRSKKSRAVAHWKVKSLLSYNKDLMVESPDSYHLHCQNGTIVVFLVSHYVTSFTMIIDKDGGYSWQLKVLYKHINPDATFSSCEPIYLYDYETLGNDGSWQFMDDNRQISFTNFLIHTYFNMNSSVWDILELREKQMKLKSDNGYYELLLIKE